MKTFRHIPWRIKMSYDAQWYFILVSANNKVVMTSETYTTPGNARRGIKTACGLLGLPFHYQEILVVKPKPQTPPKIENNAEYNSQLSDLYDTDEETVNDVIDPW